MKFPRNARIFRGQLDASPFVGVLFLVAIFLLLNSSLVFVPGIAINLPEAVINDYRVADEKLVIARSGVRSRRENSPSARTTEAIYLAFFDVDSAAVDEVYAV